MTLSTSTYPQTWLELIEKGDGYLNPEQRKAFEQAIALVMERLTITLGRHSTPAEQNEPFDFSTYIERLEDRFLADAEQESELQQDAALTAARVVSHIAQLIQSHTPR
ncbi:hypothetical protein [Vibrio porteresiae]|uniref:Uncharacterized protein n=1 Tax=Vibrio porteresiae DSM 19223 TaxID=1123496 RepID=A0ABZ0QAJ6_9VIBR|nr:hypothetical protein [Vibrio porteresiae]WPC73482.1 hypothetical protein R8Z52_15390 [Vibrio porteresiae DSM 19223]